MGAPQAKQFLEIDGRPILALTLFPFEQCEAVDGLVLAVPQEAVDYCRREIVERHGIRKVRAVVAGGGRRQDSVRAGLEAAGSEFGWVLVHDGVRPMVTPEFLTRVIRAGRRHGAVTAALPVKETVKEVSETGAVLGTLRRENLRTVQTPQVFRFPDLLRAHRLALEEGWEEAADDAVLIEKLGIPVQAVEGLEENVKITTPEDLAWARWWFGRRRPRTE